MPKIKRWISWSIRYNPCKVCLSFSHKLRPKFGKRWISRIGSLRFWWNSVQRNLLMRTMCTLEIFKKKCRQQQIFDSDLQGAWHYNHVTFTPIAKNFMLYRRLIYMLSILCVRLTIKVEVGIPESFKVGWYPPPKKTGSSHLKYCPKCAFLNPLYFSAVRRSTVMPYQMVICSVRQDGWFVDYQFCFAWYQVSQSQ